MCFYFILFYFILFIYLHQTTGVHNTPTPQTHSQTYPDLCYIARPSQQQLSSCYNSVLFQSSRNVACN